MNNKGNVVLVFLVIILAFTPPFMLGFFIGRNFEGIGNIVVKDIKYEGSRVVLQGEVCREQNFYPTENFLEKYGKDLNSIIGKRIKIYIKGDYIDLLNKN